MWVSMRKTTEGPPTIIVIETTSYNIHPATTTAAIVFIPQLPTTTATATVTQWCSALLIFLLATPPPLLCFLFSEVSFVPLYWFSCYGMSVLEGWGGLDFTTDDVGDALSLADLSLRQSFLVVCNCKMTSCACRCAYKKKLCKIKLTGKVSALPE
ncbi:uncharacterized protein G2W53_024614 [Senna tora]|uniref:Uncharacterized protein n=1 Tax=Senna tora TaxID=362788 RepID=A0A834TD39_9FABA|nr:uncharacterized protein G2W53_024614 [Senna tora]